MPDNSKKLQKHHWSGLGKETLLNLRICDLGLTMQGSPLESRIQQLYRELERKQLQFRPHFWLSDDWFCPDDVPGVAIPFYLAHPKLMRLEKEYILEVEGGDRPWCMKLLRHETAHAICNAYQLTKLKEWRKVFGNPNAAYRDTYLPKPYSKSFVINLPLWYAQSHPLEDWAETFAVWLNPKSDWQNRYRRWPALKKLHFVSELMQQLRERKPRLRNKKIVHPAEKIRTTLAQYYQDKRQRYGVDSPEFFDVDLRVLFCTKEQCPGGEKASRFLRRMKKPALDIVEQWTGEYKYRINEVLKDMIKRCDELKLHVERCDEELLPELTACLTMLVMNNLHSGGFHISR